MTGHARLCFELTTALSDICFGLQGWSVNAAPDEFGDVRELRVFGVSSNDDRIAGLSQANVL